MNFVFKFGLQHQDMFMQIFKTKELKICLVLNILDKGFSNSINEFFVPLPDASNLISF